MKTSPSGFQVTVLLFALAFGAMLVTTAVAQRIGLPNEHFNTLGNLIWLPLELALVFAIPALRKLALEGLRHPLPMAGRVEAVSIAVVKVLVTFGVWGAVALWGLHVTQRSAELGAYGFLTDRTLIDQRYFTTWGLIGAAIAITVGPITEEILYRGVLYRLWERQWGWIAGVLLSATVFSVVHPNNLVQTFLSAILYACLFRRTGSLWASILCHLLYNSVVTWPLLGHVLQVKPVEAATSIGPWIPNLVCLALGGIAFVVYVGLAARKPATQP